METDGTGKDFQPLRILRDPGLKHLNFAYFLTTGYSRVI